MISLPFSNKVDHEVFLYYYAFSALQSSNLFDLDLLGKFLEHHRNGAGKFRYTNAMAMRQDVLVFEMRRSMATATGLTNK